MNKLTMKIIPDQSIVDISNSTFIAYWTDRLGVTETLLKEAINAVGNATPDVEDYINKVITYYMHIYAI